MRLKLRDGLPFLAVTITCAGKTLELRDVLVDTGSASSIVSADRLAEIGVLPSPETAVHYIRGVGGREAVFSRRVDSVRVGAFEQRNFEVDVGGMDYGFPIQGILGMDFLRASRAVVDLGRLALEFAP